MTDPVPAPIVSSPEYARLRQYCDGIEQALCQQAREGKATELQLLLTQVAGLRARCSMLDQRCIALAARAMAAEAARDDLRRRLDAMITSEPLRQHEPKAT